MRGPLWLCFLALVPLVDCGGSDSHDSPCDAVCDCVKDLGGDRHTCLDQCQNSDQTADTCRSGLQQFGYSSCSSHCDAFGGGAGGSSAGAAGAACGPAGGGGTAGNGGTPNRDGGAGGPAGGGGVGGQAGNGGTPNRDGGAGGPTGGGGAPPGTGGAGGGTAGGGARAYTLTPCPGASIQPGNTAGLPDCSSICAAAHCVPTDLVGARADTLPDCPDATSKCVPDAMAETNSRFVFRTCASALDPTGHGRCVPICVAGSSASFLQRDVCGPNELCAPCIDPSTQLETGACGDFCAPPEQADQPV